ncbi:MAG: hypothetical protein EON92_19460 [Burkholderiales bacterium]|nr:MAG: hypothetical protein EON92_19460 [Burkholderiales bacterium]
MRKRESTALEARHKLGQDVQLHALFPHMHLRGKSFSYEARLPDGTREQLLSVPRYQFNWQGVYHLAQPRMLPANTEIVARATISVFNPANPDPSKVVHWGYQTFDEMLAGYLLYTVPRRESPR